MVAMLLAKNYRGKLSMAPPVMSSAPFWPPRLVTAASWKGALLLCASTAAGNQLVPSKLPMLTFSSANHPLANDTRTNGESLGTIG